MIISEMLGKKNTIYRLKCDSGGCKKMSKKASNDMNQVCMLARREGFITISGKRLTDPMIWLCCDCKKLHEESN